MKPYLKNISTKKVAEGIAQVRECLSSNNWTSLSSNNCKALRPNSNIINNMDNNNKKMLKRDSDL
jgi:hypothetical protein